MLRAAYKYGVCALTAAALFGFGWVQGAQRTITNLRADVKRLRDNRASGGGLSAPATSAESPGRICFDPAKLSGALRKFDEGVLGLVEGCSEAVINLDTAKKWAQENE